MNDRQLGRFMIPARLLHERPDTVADALALLRVVPIGAEMSWAEDAVEYLALCEMFKEVEMGRETPRYILSITEDDYSHVNLIERGAVSEIQVAVEFAHD